MNKQWTGACVLLLALNGAAAAQTCALPQIADQAALQPVAASNLVTVPVAINGKPKQFLLDLGAGPISISEAAVADLGLPQTMKMSSTIQSAGVGFTGNSQPSALGTFQAPVYDVKGNQAANAQRARVRVAAFTLGGATANNLQFMVASDGEIARGAPYDGMLTTDILKQYDVEVDFAGKQINFLTPAKCSDVDQIVFWSHGAVGEVPMEVVNGRIVVPVTIEGHAINAVIDTTSTRSVMRRDIAELALGLKPGTAGTIPDGETKDGMGLPVYVHTFPQIVFAGGVTAVNVPALIQTNGMLRDADGAPMRGSRAVVGDARIADFTLGMDVLHQLHLYAVFGHKKLYVTAAR
ncbi:MAG TPA: retroviral-like aspartic protease family protein [Rhizomicrobium sp.]|jgi:predicted aspartyl protease|nr:retroviral-like aspartic protease family protein [Rhizomicrobium sp.]